MQFRLSLLFAFMALFAFAYSNPTTTNTNLSIQLQTRGSTFSKPKPQIKPYTGPGALDTKGGGGGQGNPEIKAFYPTGNPNPETPLDASKNSQSRNSNTAGKQDDYFGNWQAYSKPKNRKRDYQFVGLPNWL